MNWEPAGFWAVILWRGQRGPEMANGECAVRSYSKPISAVNWLNRRFYAQIYTVSKMFSTYRDLYNNPQEFGIADGKNACCGQGPYNGLKRCSVVSNFCPDRGNNVWWDQFHPTERARRITVDEIFSSSTSSVTLVSLRDLMKLDVWCPSRLSVKKNVRWPGFYSY